MRRLYLIVLAGCLRFEPSGSPAPAGDAGADSATDSMDGAPGIDGPPSSNIIEAEDFSAKTDSPTRTWASTIVIGGFSGASYMQCGPGTAAFCANDATLDSCAASMDYAIVIATSGTYHVHLRVTATSSADDSVYYGMNDVPAPTDIVFPQTQQWEWRTGTTTFNLAAGNHTLTIWQRECGARVDVVAVTASPIPPP